MCSLFDQSLPLEEIVAFYDVREVADGTEPRANIRPKTPVTVIRQGEVRTVETMRWGLVPGWMKEEPKVQPCNARAETVATNGMFRNALRSKRCILPAAAYAEFEGPKGKRTPVWFEPLEGILSIAGLWEEWRAPDGEVLRTATMLTFESNAVAAEFHDRMPAVLSGSDAVDIWMDNEHFDKDELRELLLPFPAEKMRAVRRA